MWVGHITFDHHFVVGHSVLCQIEGVGHVFCNHHILKCSTPPPPTSSPLVLFDQSLMTSCCFATSPRLGDVKNVTQK